MKSPPGNWGGLFCIALATAYFDSHVERNASERPWASAADGWWYEPRDQQLKPWSACGYTKTSVFGRDFTASVTAVTISGVIWLSSAP